MKKTEIEIVGAVIAKDDAALMINIFWTSIKSITHYCSWLRGRDCLRSNQSSLGFEGCKGWKKRKEIMLTHYAQYDGVRDILGKFSLQWGPRNCCQLTFSRSSDLFSESSNDSACSVMLVEGMRQFLASSLQLLPQGEAMKHYSILDGKKKTGSKKLLKREKKLLFHIADPF